MTSLRVCRQTQQARVSTTTQASPVEIMQVANEAAFISGVAGTMISMTLIVRFHASFSLFLFEGFVPSLSVRAQGQPVPAT